MATAEGLLDPMPDIDLLGHSLDLRRRELRALMNRYSSSDPVRAQTSIFAPPAGLIVTTHEDQGQLVGEALESEGWYVKSCPGPGGTECPMLHGQQCELRESVDAAIVYVDPAGLRGGTGMIPRLRCAADRASPGVIALEGSMDQPRYWRTTAMVGARRGVKSILETLRRLQMSGRPGPPGDREEGWE